MFQPLLAHREQGASCFQCIFFATFQTFRGNINEPWMLKGVKVNGAIKADYIIVFFGLLLLVFLQICYNGCTCKSKLQCNFLSVNMSKKMHFISSSSFTNKTENQSGYPYRMALNVCQNRLV